MMEPRDFFKLVQDDLELAHFVHESLLDHRKIHETWEACLHRILDEHRRFKAERDARVKSSLMEGIRKMHKDAHDE